MKAYKINTVVLIAAVVFGCVEGQQIGLCTADDFMIKAFHCQTAFIHSLQKKPNSDCSVELKDLHDCLVKQGLSCFPELARTDAAKKTLMSSYEKLMTKEKFCDQAGILLDDQTIEEKATLKALTCDITMSEYTAIFNRCLKPVVNMWQANKADKRLCGEYTKAKICQNKALFDDRKCVPKDDTIRKYDHYNSFCSDGRDPVMICTASTFLPHKILLFFVPLMKMLF